MSAKILFWVFVLFGAGFEIVGDVFFKKWTVENKPLLMWAGFIIYSIGTLFWAFSLKYETLSKAISIFTILNLVIVALIGIIFFKENISVISKIGIVLGIISIVLIERG
ncbi:MAG: SMR family transporter [Candidatus Moranbacteria bacterium]|nr:SMR family transporter [Candidatus Moranbacteria bacterium]